jgi:hypothetical protein
MGGLHRAREPERKGEAACGQVPIVARGERPINGGKPDPVASSRLGLDVGGSRPGRDHLPAFEPGPPSAADPTVPPGLWNRRS